jgi:hypothetical protein
MSYARVRVEKVGVNYTLDIDGTPHRWGRQASDLLTGEIKSSSDYIGIFSTRYDTVPFYKGRLEFHINFGATWHPSAYPSPLAEIRRRVRLVQETFAKAEAEKEVWEGIVGDLPPVEPEKVETFTIIYTGDKGQGYKYVTTTTRSLLIDKLSEFSNPIFVFKGEPETV